MQLEDLEVVAVSLAALVTAFAGLRFVVRSQCVGIPDTEEDS